MGFVTANFDYRILKRLNSINFIKLCGFVPVSLEIFVIFFILIPILTNAPHIIGVINSSCTTILAYFIRFLYGALYTLAWKLHLFHEVTRLSVLGLCGLRERVCKFDKYNAITRLIFIVNIIFSQNICYGDLGCIDDGAFALVNSENFTSIFIQ